MKRLTIIRGLPGSGKTTMAKALAQKDGALHFEADMWFEGHDGYKFDAAQLKFAHAWCLYAALAALTYSEHVIVSNTFTRLWEMQKYIDGARELGARFEVIKADGQWENIHGVPQETIARMRERWEEWTA